VDVTLPDRTDNLTDHGTAPVHYVGGQVRLDSRAGGCAPGAATGSFLSVACAMSLMSPARSLSV
jgi:hypothetical protein